MTLPKPEFAPSHDRLQAAALELFREQGFDVTTAAQIAAKAGVTERTFFRYFADKREVLFDGEDRVRQGLLEAIGEAPESLGSLDTLFAAFHAFRPELESRRDYARPRQHLIDVTPALQERELAKIAALSDAIAVALQQRGTPALEAVLAARTAMAAFAHATAQWLQDESLGLGERFDQARRSLANMTEFSASRRSIK
jgi:AcrR family transcriptional regulator